MSFKTNCRIPVQGWSRPSTTIFLRIWRRCAARRWRRKSHARYSCTGKRYVYKIRNSEIRSPFEQDQVWVYYKYPIDAEALHAAAQGFIGTYDYQAFCSPGGSVEDTVRTIYDFSVRREGEMVEFSVTGSGFLYNMVRIMVGTLLAAGMGKIPCTPEAIRAIVLSKNRAPAGGRVPPCGLYLDKVL